MDLSDIGLLKRLDEDESKEYGIGSAKASPEKHRNSRKNSVNLDSDFDGDDDDLADLLYDDDDDVLQKKKTSPKKASVITSPKSTGTKLADSPLKKPLSSDKSFDEKDISLNKNQGIFDNENVEQSMNETSKKGDKSVLPRSATDQKQKSRAQNKMNGSPKKSTKNKIDLFLQEEEEKYLGDLGLDNLENLSPTSGFSNEKSGSVLEKSLTPSKKSVDVEFDDNDDILDSLESTTKKASPVKSKRQSFMDDLLGSNTPKKSAAKLSSIFDDKPQKGPKEGEQDDVMVFGGYVPSSASPSRATSSRRRTTRFNDEVDVLSSPALPKQSPSKEPNFITTPRNRSKLNNESVLPSHKTETDSNKAVPFRGKIESASMESPQKAKKDDWLDFMKKPPDSDLPKPSVRETVAQFDKTVTKNEIVNTRRKSSGADWLGLGDSDMPKSKKLDEKSTIPSEELGDNYSSASTSKPLVNVGRRREQYPWLMDSLVSEKKEADAKTVIPQVHSDLPPASSKQVTEVNDIMTVNEVAKQSVFNKDRIPPHQEPSNIGPAQHSPPQPPASHSMPQAAASVVMSNVPYMPSQLPTNDSGNIFNTGAIQALLNSFQSEREQLLKSIEAITKNRESDVALHETNLKSEKIALEDSLNLKLKSAQEKHEADIKKLKAELQSLEQEKKQLISDYQNKIATMEQDHDKEAQRLRKLHNEAVSMLKQDHEDALARLKKLKDQEIEAISSTQLHSRSLQSLADQLEMRASELASLQNKVEQKHNLALQEKEAVLASKEKELKALERRLHWQIEESEQERNRLQQLVLHLEKRLQQQTKENETEHWDTLQLKTKLEVQKKYLEEEKKMLMESVEKEKEKLQMLQSTLVQEQKAVLMQLAQEQQQLRSEKLQFESTAKRIKDEEARLTARKLKEESNTESQRRMLEQESEKIYVEKDLMKQESLQVRVEKETLEREKQHMKDQKEKLAEMRLELKRRSDEVEDMARRAEADKEESRMAIAAARKIESDHQTRMNQFTQQMQLIMEKQKQLLEEREKLAEERREFEKTKNTTLCVNCKLAVGLPVTSLPPIMSQVREAAPLIANVGNIPGHPNVDPSLMVWYVTAEKDREYLQEELSFLKSLKELGKS